MCRVLLAAIAVSYLICVLVLSGLQKEDLDVNLLRRLKEHNVNVDDINNEKVRQECLTNSGLVYKNGRTERNLHENSTTEPYSTTNYNDTKDKVVELKVASLKVNMVETSTNNYATTLPISENTKIQTTDNNAFPKPLDLICLLVLSGMQKDDLDANLLRQLQEHNVSVDDVKNEKIRQECITNASLLDKNARRRNDKKDYPNNTTPEPYSTTNYNDTSTKVSEPKPNTLNVDTVTNIRYRETTEINILKTTNTTIAIQNTENRTISTPDLIICVLVLSGMHKKDLDVHLLKKLQDHNVNIDDIDNENIRKECLINSSFVNKSGSAEKMFHDNNTTTEPYTITTHSETKILEQKPVTTQVVTVMEKYSENRKTTPNDVPEKTVTEFNEKNNRNNIILKPTDITCVLVLSGMQKENMDVNLLKRLQKYDVNIDDIYDEKIREQCLNNSNTVTGYEGIQGEMKVEINTTTEHYSTTNHSDTKSTVLYLLDTVTRHTMKDGNTTDINTSGSTDKTIEVLSTIPTVLKPFDVMCSLVLSGMQKENLDVNLLTKLQTLGVNIDDIINDKQRQECLSHYNLLSKNATEQYKTTAEQYKTATETTPKFNNSTIYKELSQKPLTLDMDILQNFFNDKQTTELPTPRITQQSETMLATFKMHNTKDHNILPRSYTTNYKYTFTNYPTATDGPYDGIQIEYDNNGQPNLQSIIKFWNRIKSMQNIDIVKTESTTTTALQIEPTPQTIQANQEELFINTNSDINENSTAKQLADMTRLLLHFIYKKRIVTTTPPPVTLDDNLSQVSQLLDKLLAHAFIQNKFFISSIENETKASITDRDSIQEKLINFTTNDKFNIRTTIEPSNDPKYITYEKYNVNYNITNSPILEAPTEHSVPATPFNTIYSDNRQIENDPKKPEPAHQDGSKTDNESEIIKKYVPNIIKEIAQTVKEIVLKELREEITTTTTQSTTVTTTTQNIITTMAQTLDQNKLQQVTKAIEKFMKLLEQFRQIKKKSLPIPAGINFKTNESDKTDNVYSVNINAIHENQNKINKYLTSLVEKTNHMNNKNSENKDKNKEYSQPHNIIFGKVDKSRGYNLPLDIMYSPPAPPMNLYSIMNQHNKIPPLIVNQCQQKHQSANVLKPLASHKPSTINIITPLNRTPVININHLRPIPLLIQTSKEIPPLGIPISRPVTLNRNIVLTTQQPYVINMNKLDRQRWDYMLKYGRNPDIRDDIKNRKDSLSQYSNIKVLKYEDPNYRGSKYEDSLKLPKYEDPNFRGSKYEDSLKLPKYEDPNFREFKYEDSLKVPKYGDPNFRGSKYEDSVKVSKYEDPNITGSKYENSLKVLYNDPNFKGSKYDDSLKIPKYEDLNFRESKYEDLLKAPKYEDPNFKGSKYEDSLKAPKYEDPNFKGSKYEDSLKVPKYEDPNFKGSNYEDSLKVPKYEDQNFKRSKYVDSLKVPKYEDPNFKRSKYVDSLKVPKYEDPNFKGSKYEDSLKVPKYEDQNFKRSKYLDSLKIPKYEDPKFKVPTYEDSLKVTKIIVTKPEYPNYEESKYDDVKRAKETETLMDITSGIGHRELININNNYNEMRNNPNDQPQQQIQDIKGFHERLETDGEQKNSWTYVTKVDDKNYNQVQVTSRQQLPLGAIKRGSKYDDTHFKDFLKTQQKVNDMLERILATRAKPDGPRSVETT